MYIIHFHQEEKINVHHIELVAIDCGNCEEGYTLSYAAECVSVNKCTAGWTVLVISLTMLYWIVIVIGVFAMMYYKLPIGYLYAITYYYSMVDVLLGQYLYLYPSLHTTINILSSVFKLAPQFLGQLCLERGLNRIVYIVHTSTSYFNYSGNYKFTSKLRFPKD